MKKIAQKKSNLKLLVESIADVMNNGTNDVKVIDYYDEKEWSDNYPVPPLVEVDLDDDELDYVNNKLSGREWQGSSRYGLEVYNGETAREIEEDLKERGFGGYDIMTVLGIVFDCSADPSVQHKYHKHEYGQLEESTTRASRYTPLFNRERKYYEDLGLFANEISKEKDPARIQKLLKAGIKEAEEKRDWGAWSDMIEAAIKNENCDNDTLEYLKPIVRNRVYLGDLLDRRMKDVENNRKPIEVNEASDGNSVILRYKAPCDKGVKEYAVKMTVDELQSFVEANGNPVDVQDLMVIMSTNGKADFDAKEPITFVVERA